MSQRRPAAQADLFATGSSAEPVATTVVSEAFVQGIRAELHRTLEMVRQAADMPWANPTSALLAEMRFHSISEAWLPAAEAAELRRCFDAELARIYGPPEPESE